jgi:transposase-like protein
MAVERMRNCANVSALARELEIDRAMLYHWARLAGAQGADATATSPVRELRKQVRDLKRLLAEKTLEVDFFKGALQKARLDAGAQTALARRHLRPNPGDDADARQPEYRAYVRVDESQPDQLPFVAEEEQFRISNDPTEHFPEAGL